MAQATTASKPGTVFQPGIIEVQLDAGDLHAIEMGEKVEVPNNRYTLHISLYDGVMSSPADGLQAVAE